MNKAQSATEADHRLGLVESDRIALEKDITKKKHAAHCAQSPKIIGANLAVQLSNILTWLDVGLYSLEHECESWPVRSVRTEAFWS